MISILGLIFFSLLALSVGSLLNVIIYRLPNMQKNEWTLQCHQYLNLQTPNVTPINLAWPRSFCPHCKEQIPTWHLIPLISYILLLGRCHNCHAKINWRYPLVEGLTVTLSILELYYWGFTPILGAILLCTWLLICIFFIDLEHQLIPDVLSLSLLWLGLLIHTQNIGISLQDAIYGAVCGYMSLWIFIKAYAVFTGKIGMGNGDFKLVAALGAWLGWQELPSLLLISSASGAIIGLIYLRLTKQAHSTQLPFGPFLCISGLLLMHTL